MRTLVNAIKTRKGNKRYAAYKRRNELPSFANMSAYVGNTKEQKNKNKKYNKTEALLYLINN